jgi:hypothetical protein
MDFQLKKQKSIIKKTKMKYLYLFIFLGSFGLKAQQISLDNAFQLSFVDSFNNGTNYLNTTNWSQKFGWNVADSVHWNYDTIAIGYRKWYVPTTPAPVIPSITPYDTTNFKTSGGILSLWQRKENYSGNCWTWPDNFFWFEKLKIILK